MPTLFTPRNAVLALSTVRAMAMLYVGAYQIRAVQHLSLSSVWKRLRRRCGCAVRQTLGNPPDRFSAAGMYGVLMVLAAANRRIGWARYSVRAIALLAAAANVAGVLDMPRLGAYCFIAC